jgi:hypothetical protein
MFRTHDSHQEHHAPVTLRGRTAVRHKQHHRDESLYSRNQHARALLQHAQAYLEVAQRTALEYEQAVGMGRLMAKIAAYLEDTPVSD